MFDAPPPEWDGLSLWLARHHPRVPEIDVHALRKRLEVDPNQRPVLIDIRSSEEQAVSTLPGALCVQTVAEGLHRTSQLDRTVSIVVYCAVGVRSALLCEQLLNRGFSTVHNLRGGIFRWANAGHPMVSDVQSTTRVHPFNEQWGRLLQTPS